MPKMRYIPLVVLLSLTLACGAQAELPGKTGETLPPSATPTALVTVEMVVNVDEGLYIRTGAGETFPLVEGKHILINGDVVTCSEFLVVGDGLWCRHEKGWSNARWLVGYNVGKEK